MNQKVLSLLGLSAKAGRLKSGNFQVEDAVRSHRAALVLAAGDSSESSLKKYSDLCDYYHTEFYIDGTGEEISHAIGKSGRMIVAVTDPGFASSIRGLMKSRNTMEDNE